MSHPRPIPFRVYLITDERPALGGRVAAALAAVPAGTVGVQLRAKGASGRELWGMASAIRLVTESFGAPLVVNERADVARAVGADGVHLPADAMAADAVRRFWPDALVGRSVHGPAEAAAAAAEGCAFVVAGPVFATPSKAGLGDPLGLGGLARCRAALGGGARPVLFALGGLDPSNARVCLEAGADGVACIRAVLGAADPGAAAAELVAVVAGAPRTGAGTRVG